MSTGLPITQLVNVQVNLAPTAAQAPNINTMLIVGDSNVIDVNQRIRQYGSLAAVATDFGTAAPEYLAATEYFGQTPTPTSLFIGRWAKTATPGILEGAPLTTAQQALANFTSVTNGAFKIAVDGGAVTAVSGINLASVTNLNGVASAVTTALTTATIAATCVWTGSAFWITTSVTGATASISFATSPASGTDISTLLGLTQAAGATSVAGIVAETALTAVTILDQGATPWYGLGFAGNAGDLADADYLAVASYVEAAGNRHYFFVTDQESQCLSSTDSTSLLFQLSQLSYNRTLCQYSSSSPYAAISAAGRILTTNFLANNTTITLMYKQEPGVAPEFLTSSQAAALNAKNGVYYAEFNNNTAIIVNGCSVSGLFTDEVIGIDWFAGELQTDLFNALYSNPTKVPQTDAGMNALVAVAENTCEEGVANGLFAPGVWQFAGFGQLAQGATLTKGYYVYVAPVATQNTAQRQARQSVPLQIAVKMAGAVHTIGVVVTVNR